MLHQHGIHRLRELDWDDRLEHGPLRITGQRCRHFSSRGFGDRQRNLWLAFLLEGPAGRVYFVGDTSYGSHFAETGGRFAPIRLAILPIGAYEPDWFLGSLHMNPAEAVQAHHDLRAMTSLAAHFGTFRLSQEGQDQPVADLRAALADRGMPPSSFRILTPGAGMSVPPLRAGTR